MKKTKKLDGIGLPERISYLRDVRKLTQAELAKKAKLSQSTVAQIEAGKKDPSIETLKKLAMALEVHIAILFAGDNVHVFDMPKLKKKYDSVEKLNPTLFHALGMVVNYAKDIGYLK